MEIKFSKDFKKQYQKADKKIKSSFDNRLTIFIEKPFHPQLNNHALTGRLKGYRSINVTGDWRALYSIDKDKIIVFEVIGTHSQLYN